MFSENLYHIIFIPKYNIIILRSVIMSINYYYKNIFQKRGIIKSNKLGFIYNQSLQRQMNLKIKDSRKNENRETDE